MFARKEQTAGRKIEAKNRNTGRNQDHNAMFGSAQQILTVEMMIRILELDVQLERSTKKLR